MTTNEPIDRAKFDLHELVRKIGMLEQESMRLEMTKRGLIAERDKIKAFIELSAKYASPPTELGAVLSPMTMTAEATVTEMPKPAPAVIGPPTEAVNSAATKVAASAAKKSKRRKSGKIQRVPRKPEGIPRINDMILGSLKSAREQGKPGLAPKEITDFVRQRWWPHVQGSSIGPIAWRMWKDKEIEKRGDLYALLRAA